MIDGSAISELRKVFPATWLEIGYWAILSITGAVILFQPDHLFIIRGIELDGILDQPNWVGLFLLIGALNLIWITRFSRWVKARVEY